MKDRLAALQPRPVQMNRARVAPHMTGPIRAAVNDDLLRGLSQDLILDNLRNKVTVNRETDRIDELQAGLSLQRRGGPLAPLGLRELRVPRPRISSGQIHAGDVLD